MGVSAWLSRMLPCGLAATPWRMPKQPVDSPQGQEPRPPASGHEGKQLLQPQCGLEVIGTSAEVLPEMS